MTSVELYMYDLSKGLSETISKSLVGKKFEAIWHTAIVVYETEYFFGTGGICSIDCGENEKVPDRILQLGITDKSQAQFVSFLRELGEDEFDGEKYRLMKHNCNTFSDRASVFLTGQHIPEEITSLPQDILATPTVIYGKAIIKGVTTGMKLGMYATSAVAGKVAEKILDLPVEKVLQNRVTAGENSSRKLKTGLSKMFSKKEDDTDHNYADVSSTTEADGRGNPRNKTVKEPKRIIHRKESFEGKTSMPSFEKINDDLAKLSMMKQEIPSAPPLQEFDNSRTLPCDILNTQHNITDQGSIKPGHNVSNSITSSKAIQQLFMSDGPFLDTNRNLLLDKCEQIRKAKPLLIDLINFARNRQHSKITPKHFALLELIADTHESIGIPLLELFRVILCRHNDLAFGTLLTSFTIYWHRMILQLRNTLLPSKEFAIELMKVACNWLYLVNKERGIIPKSLSICMVELCSAALTGELEQILMATKLAYNLTLAVKLDKQIATELIVSLLQFITRVGKNERFVEAHDYAVLALRNLSDIEQLVHFIAANSSESGDLSSPLERHEFHNFLNAT